MILATSSHDGNTWLLAALHACSGQPIRLLLLPIFAVIIDSHYHYCYYFPIESTAGAMTCPVNEPTLLVDQAAALPGRQTNAVYPHTNSGTAMRTDCVRLSAPSSYSGTCQCGRQQQAGCCAPGHKECMSMHQPQLYQGWVGQ